MLLIIAQHAEADLPTWHALGSTSREWYDTLLEPVRARCDAFADALLQHVWQRVNRGLAEDAIRYADAHVYRAERVRDGIYRYADQDHCDAAPYTHVHDCCIRYTRNGRDIDLWECELDGRKWTLWG